ncbi:MAG: hypothetical protein ABJ246_03645 [Paracoccaceae bacterium]
MTWVLFHQNNFGPYFLNANFVGQKEKVKAEFDRIATDAMKANYGQAFMDFSDKAMVSYARPKVPAEPYQQAEAVQLERSQKDVADVFKVSDSLTVVSAPVRDVILSIAQDDVQFWPIDILNPRGQAIGDTTYFAMLPLTAREGFRPDASVDGSCRESFGGANQWHIATHKKAFLKGLAIQADKVKSANVWHEPLILTPAIFFSDELGAALTSGGFKLPPNFLQCVSV